MRSMDGKEKNIFYTEIISYVGSAGRRKTIEIIWSWTT